MKKLLLSLFLLLPLVVHGQEQKLEIRNFGGLNTVAGDFAIQPNEARMAYNIDWGANVGSITKRLGYDSVSVLTGMDSIIAIYPAYYSDGTQQLFVVADSAGIGYGSVYVTAKGSVALDSLTKIWEYWSVFGYPSFTMVGDNVYIVNGYNRGIVYYDGLARSYPPKAPSEPTIVPLDDAGNINGEYRYVFYVGSGDSTSISVDTTTDTTYYYCAYRLPPAYGGGCVWSVTENSSEADSTAIVTTIDTSLVTGGAFEQSVVSDKIRVRNGHVLITEFQYPITDSVTTTNPDSVRITVTRTRANPGRLTPETKIYYVGDFAVTNPDSAKRYVFVDTMSDTTMVTLYSSLGAAIDVSMGGRDSTGAVSYRYGSPRFVTQDTIGTDNGNTYTYTDSTDTTSAFGIFHGILDQRDTLGYAYMCTFIDTVTSVESDSGRSLFVWLTTSQRSGAKPFFNTITLPKITADDSGLLVNLYRSPIKQITYDSSYWQYIADANGAWAVTTIKLANESGRYEKVKVQDGKIYGWIYSLTPDTVVANEYYLIGQFPVTDTIYTDSLRQDSVATKRRYFKSTPPDIMSKAMTYQSRLYGVDGSKLWRSGLLDGLTDTLQTWGQMDYQALNESDGDIGTVAYPTRTAIRFMKNFGSFNIYEDFSKTEISNTIGCVAPNSYASGIGGHYYLSDVGVIYETDGQQLERTFNTNLVSAKIDNLDNYDITEKQKAYATYFDRKYMLTLGDSTYVYDERSGGWSVWGFRIASSAKYGAESQVSFIPGDTLYFTMPGDSVLYRYGSSEYDNGVTIQIIWQSAPLFTNNNLEKLNAIGLWCNSSDVDDSLVVQVFNEEGASNNDNLWFTDLSQRYYEKGYSTKESKYMYLKLGTLSNTALNSTIIDGLDIYFTVMGKAERE